MIENQKDDMLFKLAARAKINDMIESNKSKQLGHSEKQ